MSTTTIEPTLHAVIAQAAARIAVPRRSPADSFVLHAPLELLGRAGLLPFVHDGARAEALDRIQQLADEYEAADDPVGPPVDASFEDPSAATARLIAAIEAGDLDEVDTIATWLGDHSSHHELRGLLGEYVVPSLAAAGHAPIALSLLPRVADGRLPATLLRGPLREIARHPGWRLTWFESTQPTTRDATHEAAAPLSLFDALATVPRLGIPGNAFIHPLMSQVEQSGVAERLLAPVIGDRCDVTAARHTLARVAAWSMINDDPAHAAYGWSHCLTMPSAVMDLVGLGVSTRTGLAVAATHVAGFRAALSNVELAEPGLDAGALRAEPEVRDLATFAALHHDAHLVKYTLACLHAAADDVAMRPLYLLAAQHLADWWRANPDAA